MILIATFGSRSRKLEEILAPQHEQFASASPAVASAVRLWPSSTATSPNRSPGPMKFSVSRLPSEAPVSMRTWPRRTPNRASPGSPFWNSTSPSQMLGVAEIGRAAVSSSVPRSANIGFIFRMTANSACLLIAIPFNVSSRQIGHRQNRRAREVCHKSHNFAAPRIIFERLLSSSPFCGISLGTVGGMAARAGYDAVCPVGTST